MEPHVKSLHLTLAYQFPSAQYNALKALVEELNPSLATSWELRLYSRDPRLATKQVHKVLYPYTPREPDELELRIGDYIYLNSETIKNSTDGWVEGISWLTGNCGFLPASYTEHTAESDAWTMHRTVELCKSTDPSIETIDEVDGCGGESLAENDGNFSINTNSMGNDYVERENSLQLCHENDLEVDLPKCLENISTNHLANRKLFVMRHGERVDFTFGSWVPYCFDEEGKYNRKDLNMPKILPNRNNHLSWKKDSPLTNIGYEQAKLVGDALKDSNIQIDHAFCSPSFRCIQTCSGVLEGLGIQYSTPIAIEPGLFEWMIWYPDGVPSWLKNNELQIAKFNIAVDYQPLITSDDLQNQCHETLEEFYQRNNDVTQKILSQTEGNVLLVGHAASVDTCTRQLQGREFREITDLTRIIQKVPYCSIVALECDNKKDWKFIDQPCHPITHSNNQRYDWKILQ